jgi:hypothetical protein
MIIIDEKQFVKAVTVTLVTIGLVTAVVVSYRLYSGTQRKLSEQKKNESTVKSPSQNDSDVMIITQVSKHIVLPDETPKVVKVTDVDTLKKSEPFFQSAQDGDDVLVYSNKVILYSPKLDRIVEVAQIKAGK